METGTFDRAIMSWPNPWKDLEYAPDFQSRCELTWEFVKSIRFLYRSLYNPVVVIPGPQLRRTIS